MKKIEEIQIQNILETIGQNNQESAALMAKVYERYAVIFNYLETSYASVFDAEEAQYLEFANFVILAACNQADNDAIDLNDLIASDEEILALIEKDKNFNLEQHLNNEYDDVIQQDLLEFVIEYIYEEETEISTLSKDLMASFLFGLIQAIELGEGED